MIEVDCFLSKRIFSIMSRGAETITNKATNGRESILPSDLNTPITHCGKTSTINPITKPINTKIKKTV